MAAQLAPSATFGRSSPLGEQRRLCEGPPYGPNAARNSGFTAFSTAGVTGTVMS
jgi:hypothetical protein